MTGTSEAWGRGGRLRLVGRLAKVDLLVLLLGERDISWSPSLSGSLGVIGEEGMGARG